MGKQLKPLKQQLNQEKVNMSEWVRLDITAFTKTTNKEKILKILKGAKVECCEITDPYMNTDRNKNCISIVIKRADFESKSPDYPGSWIIEEDYFSKQHLIRLKISYLRIQTDPKFSTMLFTFNHVNRWTIQQVIF